MIRRRLALGLVLGGLLAAGSADARPLRLMAIGDSLVQGGRFGTDDYTFRYPLFLGLRDAGFDVDFVGARRQGLNPDFTWPPGFDNEHEGFYGATSLEIEAGLEKDLPLVEAPDWAVFLLGENDDPDDPNRLTIAPLSRMIADLRLRNPEVGILVVQIPGYWKHLRLHWKVSRLAQELSQPQSPVLTVPLEDDWDRTADTYDGDHPNPRGQAKIAARILQTLLPSLP